MMPMRGEIQTKHFAFHEGANEMSKALTEHFGKAVEASSGQALVTDVDSGQRAIVVFLSTFEGEPIEVRAITYALSKPVI